MPSAIFLSLLLASPHSHALAELRAHCHLDQKPAAMWQRLDAGAQLELPLLGDPATANGLGVRVATAIQNEFGVDARCLRVIALEGPELQRRRATLEGRAGGSGVAGFQSEELGVDQTVFVDRSTLTDDDEVLVHEVLHALSPRFNQECQRAGASALLEGVTEHLTHRVMQHQFDRLPVELTHHYLGFVAAADLLARLIGENELADGYFRTGYHALVVAADAKRPGALRSAAQDLAALSVDSALVTLGDTRSEGQRVLLQKDQRCEMGKADACRELGEDYAENNPELAHQLLNQACQLGDTQGCAEAGHARAP